MFENNKSGNKHKRLVFRNAAIICVVTATVIAIGNDIIVNKTHRLPTKEKSFPSISYEEPATKEIPEPHSLPELVSEQRRKAQPISLIEKIVELRSIYSNNEIIGFLEIEGTNISYPVAQSSDNNYYLYHNLHREDDFYGSIFMDFENNPTELNDNTVIYGHNMRDGSMFHNIRYYMKESFYKEHMYISLTTPFEETKWEIFAFCKANTDFYYIETNFRDTDLFSEHLSQLMQRSEYDTGVSVDKDDKILTLSTCATGSVKNRYVLCARLISEKYAN